MESEQMLNIVAIVCVYGILVHLLRKLNRLLRAQWRVLDELATIKRMSLERSLADIEETLKVKRLTFYVNESGTKVHVNKTCQHLCCYPKEISLTSDIVEFLIRANVFCKACTVTDVIPAQIDVDVSKGTTDAAPDILSKPVPPSWRKVQARKR